jgi:hypothetical protein
MTIFWNSNNCLPKIIINQLNSHNKKKNKISSKFLKTQKNLNKLISFLFNLKILIKLTQIYFRKDSNLILKRATMKILKK